ncbi:MAG: hypothetical protein FRX49_01408 [Trebouxia sp. A1-2]|nr:MAG: hypothetical protein FRX49_01408 [Trebouxia sp. A1-2]
MPSLQSNCGSWMAQVQGWQQHGLHMVLSKQTKGLFSSKYLSKIQDGKATSSPEVLTRRGAWEEAQVHANLMAASDAGHRAPIDSTPKVPSAGANHTGRVQSCTAAQAAACKVAVVNHLATMYNKSQENPQQPIAPLPHIETQIIPRETDQRRNADEAPQAELLADQGTTSAKDRGKKLAASVAEEHISSAPWHSPTDGSDHPKQLEGQEESGRGVERVTIPTAKRSRKRSSVEVHQKGSQRQRCKSAVHEDPDLETLQTPELAGVPKPRQYRDINTVTLELQVAEGLPRESPELSPAVGDERAGAVRQQDMLKRLATAEVKLVKRQMSDVKSRVNRHLCKLQSKLRKNKMTPKQALEWDVKHLEAVLADPDWVVAQ